MIDVAALVLGRLPGGPFSEPVHRALDHLLSRYADPVPLSDLAALTGRTTFQLIRAFRKELGVTPHALLVRIRVHHATAMLARGEPIAGAAADVGFVDQTHFGRHFKRIHRVTPRRYMAALRAAAPPGASVSIH
ncbi:MAG: AraC family transcriptional regulator [Alphaproteobacteria bacterium]|nr:AraC family transcriptional regulator [Alphaproteobacteria bacterium]